MKLLGAWVAFGAGLYVIQSSLLPLLAYHGISANLLLIMVVSFSFLKGYRLGVFAGFCAGLLQDLATGSFFGCSVFSYMALGYAVGRLSDNVFKEQVFLPMFMILCATIANYLIFVSLMTLLGYPIPVVAGMNYTLFPMIVWHMAFAYPVHRLVMAADRRISKLNKVKG